MSRGSTYRRLEFYIAREFANSFAVSFIFYFFIFFINQILVLVRKVMLKNVDPSTMLVLVSSAIPQFMQYVIPFATLTASAMILGELAGSNELLAMRSLGIPVGKVFRVLIVLSILLSLATLYVADYLLPYSSKAYKNTLSRVMRDLPTFELREGGVNSIGPMVLSNGRVEKDRIYDVVLISSKNDNLETLSARSGRLSLLDSDRFIYDLELEDPRIFIHEKNIANWTLADAKSAELYLDFSRQVPALTSDAPGNRSSKELLALIRERWEDTKLDRLQYHRNREEKLLDIASGIYSSKDEASLKRNRRDIERYAVELEQLGPVQPTGFYLKYYSTELNKKFALSFAALSLTILSLSIATMRIRHGRLVGFGSATLLAVLYWYYLFACQLGAFNLSFNAGALMWLPDITMVLLGLVILVIRRRNI